MINPKRIPLQEWAHSLLVDYPEQNLPQLQSDNVWREWAAEVIKSPLFSNPSIPNPYAIDDWKEWAALVYGIIN